METASLISLICTILKLAWELYKQFKDAPSYKKKEVLDDIKAMHTAIESRNLGAINAMWAELLATKSQLKSKPK